MPSAAVTSLIVAPLRVEDVELALARSPWLAIRFLQVNVDDGLVKLSGCVRTYYEKQVARQVVLRIPGVRQLDDQVEVFGR